MPLRIWSPFWSGKGRTIESRSHSKLDSGLGSQNQVIMQALFDHWKIPPPRFKFWFWQNLIWILGILFLLLFLLGVLLDNVYWSYWKPIGFSIEYWFPLLKPEWILLTFKRKSDPNFTAGKTQLATPLIPRAMLEFLWWWVFRKSDKISSGGR